jgi:glycosyltransferase involved in cell wall biosynthesis
MSTIRGLTSIIIPCWGQLEFTQQCIAALKCHTRPSWELIVIDNGSTDQTGVYLAGVRDMSAVPVTVVSNATNLDFPAAINQGLRLARGEYLVLLNNDVAVTDRWLDQLIGLVNAKNGAAETGLVPSAGNVPGSAGFTPPSPPFKGVEQVRDQGCSPLPAARDGRPAVGIGAGSGDPRTALTDGIGEGEAPPEPRDAMANRQAGSHGGSASHRLPAASPIGLVGPMSNYAAPPQLVEAVPYHDISEMHSFAVQWREQHLGKWFTVPKLSGFCLLMTRAVYEKVGGLDERFGLGFFDDDDLAERARRAGFELAVAHDLFVPVVSQGGGTPAPR